MRTYYCWSCFSNKRPFKFTDDKRWRHTGFTLPEDSQTVSMDFLLAVMKGDLEEISRTAKLLGDMPTEYGDVMVKIVELYRKFATDPSSALTHNYGHRPECNV